MSNVGNYEILDELSLTPHGSVCRARRANGEPGNFAIKRLFVKVDDPSEPNWELQTFLDRARVQQTLAGGGAKYWAPIHDLGIEVDSAWYVTDYHPLSAQKLIDGQIFLKPENLYALVLGVLKGLSELGVLRNRSHGNLHARNILLGGSDLQTAPILLTDPATNGQAAKLGEIGDLRALGELIYTLVMHRAPVTDDSPIPASAQWGALGATGPEWRRLCTDLLNPTLSVRLSLAVVAQRMNALRPRRKLGLRKFFVTAAVLAVLAGSAVTVLSVLDHTARAQLAQAKDDWFGKILDATADPAHLKTWKADPDLGQLISRIQPRQIRAINCNPDHLICWKYSDYARVSDALNSVQMMQNEFPANWKKASRAETLRTRLLNRGWKQPAEFLGKVVDDVKPAPGKDLPAAIDRLLVVSPSVEAGMALADSDWKTFTDRISTISAMHDPVLNKLAAMLQQSASSEVHLTDAGFTGLDEVAEDSARAGGLSDAIRDTWPTNVTREAFDRDVRTLIHLDDVKKRDIKTWLDLVKFHTIRRDLAVAESEKLRKQLGEAISVVNRAHIATDEVAPFKAASDQASLAISDFEQAPFTNKSIEEGKFELKRNEVSNRIENLKKFYHPEGPDQWLAGLPIVATSSTAINARWEAWRKVLTDSMQEMMRDRSVFAARQDASEKLRLVLISLDQNFPPAPSLPDPEQDDSVPKHPSAFTIAAQLHREQSIEKLLAQIDPGSPALDSDKVKASVDESLKWTGNLVALSRDFPIRKKLLNPTDHPDADWKTKKPDFWNDPAVQALVKNDVSRLARIASMQAASRNELIKTMSGGGDAEVALAAWDALGSDRISPPWPAKSSELTIESKFHTRLAASLKLLKDPAEAEAPAREIAEQEPIRWRKFVENCNSEQMIQNAWSLREDFAIDANQLAKLSAAAHYNLDLEIFHESISGGDEKEVRTALAELSTAAAGLKNRPEIADLPARIALIDVKEPFADRSPGDIFSITFPGAAHPVEFKRIEPAAGRPFYLCTTDVSVSQFAAVMDANKGWAEAWQLPWPYEQGKPDTRRGPRTWEWGGTSVSPMTNPLLWLTPEEFNDYPQAFRAGKFNRMALADRVGGNPGPEHPIQYVSAQVALFYAALCDCRLPTPAEWKIAYETYEQSVPIDKWNLRDLTWETQRRYVASGGAGRWPDEGIFSAGRIDWAEGRNATSRPENDGALFFQPVNGSGGATFHHLVGNVSQFVCDAPQVFDHAANKKTAGGIRGFVEQAPKSIYVIGGSALSPLEVPFDKPQPVMQTEEAYADVGVRLAFTAPSRSLVEKVKWAIGSPAFIWTDAKVAGK